MLFWPSTPMVGSNVRSPTGFIVATSGSAVCAPAAAGRASSAAHSSATGAKILMEAPTQMPRGTCGERIDDHGQMPHPADLASVLAALSDRAVPGLAAMVVREGEVVEQHAVGVADLGTARPVTLDTAYLWFSMTKIVTATAVMQLVERGRLRLE